jgi:hypothetical protein
MWSSSKKGGLLLLTFRTVQGDNMSLHEDLRLRDEYLNTQIDIRDSRIKELEELLERGSSVQEATKGLDAFCFGMKVVRLESRIKELLNNGSSVLGSEEVIKLAAEVGALRHTNAHLSAITKAKCAEVKRLDQGINALADTPFAVVSDIAKTAAVEVKDLQQQLDSCEAGSENLRKQCVKDNAKMRGLDSEIKFLEKEAARVIAGAERIYLTRSLHDLTLNGHAVSGVCGNLHCGGETIGRYYSYISTIVIFTKEPLLGGYRIK